MRLLLCFLVLAAACEQPLPLTRPASTASPIVGGTKTSGWPAVGALVADVPGYGYMGPFCTATLIAPSWVLTAAHCISSYQGMPIMPFFVKFYLGTDANASWGGKPATGKLYQTEEFFPHPDYDPTLLTVGHDIGLVRLKGEVTDVEPVVLNQKHLSGSHLNSRVLFVGFGVSDGKKQTGSGIKRETTMPMTWFDPLVFNTEPDGSGTCSGDSGGPGFLQMEPDGPFVQIGVVSAGTQSPGTTGDPCLQGYGIYTRVDAHISWIAQVTGIAFVPCNGEICLCEAACNPDGGCENDRCRTEPCLSGMLCFSKCNTGDIACLMDCRLRLKPGEDTVFDKLTYCIENKCASAQDVAQCVQTLCSDRLFECLKSSEKFKSCSQYANCLGACPEANAFCHSICDVAAEPVIQTAWNALSSCSEGTGCTVGSYDRMQYDPCLLTKCLAEVDACFSGAECNPLGGTCPEGTACVVLADERFHCVLSGGVSEGRPCDPKALAPCADGMRCVTVDEGAECRRACFEDTDCAGLCVKDSEPLGFCAQAQQNTDTSDSSESTYSEDVTSNPASPQHSSGGSCNASQQAPCLWPCFLLLAPLLFRLGRRNGMSRL